MGPIFDDLALLHHDNSIHARNCRQPVRNGQNSFALFVDAGNDRVGIGTTPNAQLEVNKSANDSADLVRIQNTNTGASARSMLKTQGDTGHGQFGVVSSGWTADSRIPINHAYVYGSAGLTLLTES